MRCRNSCAVGEESSVSSWMRKIVTAWRNKMIAGLAATAVWLGKCGDTGLMLVHDPLRHPRERGEAENPVVTLDQAGSHINKVPAYAGTTERAMGKPSTPVMMSCLQCGQESGPWGRGIGLENPSCRDEIRLLWQCFGGLAGVLGRSVQQAVQLKSTNRAKQSKIITTRDICRLRV
jgi:hypothetical protein